MAVGYNPTIVTSNLLAYIDAGNTRSYPGTGTIMYDLSGNGRNATVNGTPTFTNYYFTTTADTTYISLPSAGLSPGVGNFTYSIWVWFNSIDSSDTLIENGSWTDTLLFRLETNTVTVYAETTLRGSFSWTPSINTWYNVVFTRESSTTSMFVNGVLTGTPFTMTTDISIANANVFLMRSQHTTGQFINGRFSAFSVYSSALTPGEILSNFSALRGRFGI